MQFFLRYVYLLAEEMRTFAEPDVKHHFVSGQPFTQSKSNAHPHAALQGR